MKFIQVTEFDLNTIRAAIKNGGTEFAVKYIDDIFKNIKTDEAIKKWGKEFQGDEYCVE